MALRRWGEVADERARYRNLPGAARQTTPVDSNFDRLWRSSSTTTTACVLACCRLCRQSLRFVVDVTIRWIAILIPQRQRPERHRCGQSTLRGDAVVGPFS